jgi:hypothetical protein
VRVFNPFNSVAVRIFNPFNSVAVRVFSPFNSFPNDVQWNLPQQTLLWAVRVAQW